MAAGRREPRRKKALFFASFTCSVAEKGEGRETSTFSALLSVPLREIVILTDCCLGKMSATECGRLKPEPIFCRPLLSDVMCVPLCISGFSNINKVGNLLPRATTRPSSVSILEKLIICRSLVRCRQGNQGTGVGIMVRSLMMTSVDPSAEDVDQAVGNHIGRPTHSVQP